MLNRMKKIYIPTALLTNLHKSTPSDIASDALADPESNLATCSSLPRENLRYSVTVEADNSTLGPPKGRFIELLAKLAPLTAFVAGLN